MSGTVLPSWNRAVRREGRCICACGYQPRRPGRWYASYVLLMKKSASTPSRCSSRGERERTGTLMPQGRGWGRQRRYPTQDESDGGGARARRDPHKHPNPTASGDFIIQHLLPPEAVKALLSSADDRAAILLATAMNLLLPRSASAIIR